MEAAGAAATLLTLIGFTLQSIKTVYETTGSIRDGPPMLARLTIAAKELESVLDQLSKLAHDSQPSQQSAEQDVWNALSQNIVHCQADVLHLEKDVAALGVVKSDRLIRKVWKRVKTSLKDKDFERMWTTAQSHVGAFKLQLSIIESRRNTAHENNSILRHDTVSSSLRNLLLHSDGLRTHVAEHTNNFQSSIDDLNLQARALANGSTKVLEALGTATQSIGSHLEASTISSHKDVQDITQSLGSRLDGISELSTSQHGTIIERLTRIQKTLGERLSSPTPNIPLRSPSPAREASQGCAGLLTSIDRLGALVSEPGMAHSSEAAEAVIQELELILDFFVTKAIARATPASGTKRKRAEDETDLAVTTGAVEKMRGLLSISQSVDIAQIGPQNKPNERRCAKAGLHSRTVWDMQACTAVISCTSRPSRAAPRRQHFTTRDPVDWFEGTVSLRPKSGSSRKKLLLSFFQQFSSSGFTSLNPTLSFHALLPCDSAIFCAIELGDMTSMLGLLNDKKASLTDCDTEGRSLLCYATWHRQLDICRLLIDHGADINSVEPKMNLGRYHVCLLEQYGGIDFETTVDEPKEFSASVATRQLLLKSGADPMVPSLYDGDDGGTRSVLGAILRDSTDEALAIFLRSGMPYIDLLAKDVKGRDALALLLDSAVNDWTWRSKHTGPYIPDIPSKIATLLRHGASPNLEASSYFHECSGALFLVQLPIKIYEEILNCFCVLIKGGADIYAVDNGILEMSVTEALHFCRHGHLWEHALELCGLNVDEVYAIDHNRSSDLSDDLYAPREGCQRTRGPMDTQAYHDKCRKGLQGCVTDHRKHRSYGSISSDGWRNTWTGKCRRPNGMIHEWHDSSDEASVCSSSEDSSGDEEDNRARISNDYSEYDQYEEDDSDEEMGGVPI